jgi:hypothetical protein
MFSRLIIGGLFLVSSLVYAARGEKTIILETQRNDKEFSRVTPINHLEDNLPLTQSDHSSEEQMDHEGKRTPMSREGEESRLKPKYLEREQGVNVFDVVNPN